MKKLYKALSDFQKDCPPFIKDAQGYGYKYVELNTIIETIKPLLEKQGLVFIQPIQEDSVETIVVHIESGEFLKSTTNIPKGVSLKGMNDFQVLGSAITYLRRYSLSSMLGISTEKDTDVVGEQEKKYPAAKPWFSPGTENWTKALSQKATIETVKKHYLISKENEETYKQELLKQ